MEKPKNSRRRGDELLESLFDATFKLVKESGPGNLTFGQIADAAKTSRPVLYRRWPTPFDLLQDVYTYKARKLFEGEYFGNIQDSGSTRKDLLTLLMVYQDVFLEIGADVINNYYLLRMQDKNDQKEPPIHTIAVGLHIEAVKKILHAARLRGEQVRKVSDVTLMQPFDLIRNENLFRPGNINPGRLENMVDEVLIPVFIA